MWIRGTVREKKDNNVYALIDEISPLLLSLFTLERVLVESHELLVPFCIKLGKRGNGVLKDVIVQSSSTNLLFKQGANECSHPL